jgi:hypothetical protein
MVVEAITTTAPTLLPFLFLLAYSSLGGVLDLRFLAFVGPSPTTALLLIALNDLGVCACVCTMGNIWPVWEVVAAV